MGMGWSKAEKNNDDEHTLSTSDLTTASAYIFLLTDSPPPSARHVSLPGL